MDHIGGVQCLERAESLVDEILSVVVRKILGSNHTVHIGFHELLNYCWRRTDETTESSALS